MGQINPIIGSYIINPVGLKNLRYYDTCYIYNYFCTNRQIFYIHNVLNISWSIIWGTICNHSTHGWDEQCALLNTVYDGRRYLWVVSAWNSLMQHFFSFFSFFSFIFFCLFFLFLSFLFSLSFSLLVWFVDAPQHNMDSSSCSPYCRL